MSPLMELLRLLADGRFRSGVLIGRTLGISRAGVWKQVQALRAAGMEIHAVTGRGYRLAAPLELLSAEAIGEALPPATRRRARPIEVHYELDSTNSEWLRRAPRLPSGAVCLAEAQRSGRGRQGRRWASPCARNLYLSLLWRFPSGPDALGGLSLVVGLAVLRALDQAGIGGAGVKWPNDVVWRGAKLAGALIEMSGESGGAANVVIGIGLNVDMPREPASDPIDQPWTDATTVAGAPVSRNRLAAGLIHNLTVMIERFGADGLAPFMEEWRRRDVLQAQPVTVRLPDGSVTGEGVARGVDGGGALLVEGGGGLQRYVAGDVSVRAVMPAAPETAP